MKNKGKHRERLYELRYRNKLERCKKRRKGKRMVGIHACSDCGLESNIVGADYMKVMTHLSKKQFGLSPFLCHTGKREIITIPEVFSISENPETVIKILRRIYTIGKEKKTTELIFDHENCKSLGLSASTMLDIIVLAVDRYRQTIRHPIEYGGTIPRDELAKDILLASGLPYHLNAEYYAQVNQEQMECFETVKGVYDIEANKADKTATDMTLYFNRCLKTQNYELNEHGLNLLSTMLGEVIGNCEIHGGEGSTWYTQGHYQIQEGNPYGEMQLLFLNIGSTIYDGLKHEASEETQRRLEYILKRQYRNISGDWDEEMIYTVFALQEGISRLRDGNIKGYSKRGTGTVNLIELFYDIGECDNGLKPKMSILSGATQIIFDERYKLTDVNFKNDMAFGSGNRKIIAFNCDNDIYQRADNKNVKKLKEYFPGTAISLRFYLDSRYIEKRKAGK
ncbi:MAG: hypothetical protein NC347_03270 [Clostridium sp.]|nr:hypothetical protein [Clostridium sp.]